MKIEAVGDGRTVTFVPPKSDYDDPEHPWLKARQAEFREEFLLIVPDPDAVLDKISWAARRADGRCWASNLVSRAIGLNGGDFVPLLLALPVEKAADLALLANRIFFSPYYERFVRANRIMWNDPDVLTDNSVVRPVATAVNSGIVSPQWERDYLNRINKGLRAARAAGR